MKSNDSSKIASAATRRYDVDWLRVIAFAILIFYHVGMFFNHWEWHIKNNELSSTIEWPMRFSSQWRMSLLFMISGAGVYFALLNRKPKAFLNERFIRLFIPLLFGMFVIVPPQIFFERLTQGETYSYLEFYKTVFQFQPYPKGSFSWHHLWYLVYIFVYSLLSLPLLLFLRRRENLTRKWAKLLAKPLWLIVIPVIWHVLGSIFLSQQFPTTHNLIKDWNEHFHDFTLFVTGFIFCTQAAFWETLKRFRRLSLGIWLMLTSILYVVYWIPDINMNDWQWLIYDTIKTTNAWCILLSFFGYAYVYLQFSNRFLQYANEAVYPFYILHQTVIIFLAYPLIHSSLSITLKFTYLSITTFLVCWALYHFLIKRFNSLRLVFGLKPLKTEKQRRLVEETISSKS
jgi:glucan biosynthesis protein C